MAKIALSSDLNKRKTRTLSDIQKQRIENIKAKHNKGTSSIVSGALSYLEPILAERNATINKTTSSSNNKPVSTNTNKPYTSNAYDHTNNPTISKEPLKIYSSLYDDVEESIGLTGVKKDQVNYIVNKGKPVLEQRKKEFNDWYTPDKDTVLFNEDGSLKDIQSELNQLENDYRQNVTKLNSDQINQYQNIKKTLEEGLKHSEFLKEYEISKRIKDPDDIIDFYSLQDAYNDTFGERAVKTLGTTAARILNMPFQATDLAKDFISKLNDNPNDDFNALNENNWSQILQKDIDKTTSQIYKNTTPQEQFALQTLEGVENFGAHFLMGMATGGASTLYTMAAQSGMDKAYQNLKDGYDIQTSLGNGLLTGTLTALTEKLPLDSFTKLINSNVGKFSLSALVTQAVNEGIEEGSEYLIEPMIDKVTLGKPIEYDAGELFLTVALGMSSGGILGAVGNTVPILNTRKTYNQLNADINTLIEYKNTNPLTQEELSVVDNAIRLGKQAINNFDSTSVIGNAVKFEKDQVKQLSAREINENFNKYIQPQVDFEQSQNVQQTAVSNILSNAQSLLESKGVRMNATQYINLDEDTKAQVDKVQQYANDLGANVIFDTDLDTDGLYYDGVIVLNPNSKKAPLTTLVHEFTHGTESSENYQTLSNLITENEENLTSKLVVIKNMYKNYGINLNDEGALKEYIAITTQEQLGNEKFVERLVKYNNSLASRLYEWVKHAVKTTNTQQDIEYNFLKAFRNMGVNPAVGTQYSIAKSTDGIDVALIENAISRKEAQDLKKVKQYLQNNIGKTFKINLDGSIVNYTKYDMNEYLYSEYTKKIKKREKSNFIAKNRIVSDLGEIISVATNPKYQINRNGKIHQSNPVIGKNGFTHYDATFGIPVRDNKGNIVDYNLYEGDLIIEHNSKGKSSLYDITKIKRSNRTLDTKSMGSVNSNAQAIASVNNIANSNNNVNHSIGINLYDLKNKQLDIILQSNPVYDDYHTWIRNVEDIKTFEEALQDSDWEGWEETGFDPDYNAEDVYKALETGKIRVYSSYPISDGIFVSPSMMEAQTYSSNGEVYVKDVDLTDVAWIDPTQGMYAKVDDDYQYSIGLNSEDINKQLRKYSKIKIDLKNDLIKEGVNQKLNDKEYDKLFDKAILEKLDNGSISQETIEEIRKETWDRMVDFQEDVESNDYKEIREYVRKHPINMKSLGFTDARMTNYKRGISDFASKTDWNEFRKTNFGRIKFRKNSGSSMDSMYNELSSIYPHLFSREITSPYDQLMRVKEVLEEDLNRNNQFHLSDLGLSKEEFDVAFNDLIQDFEDEIETKTKLDQMGEEFTKALNEEFSSDDFEELFDNRMSEKTFEKFNRNQEMMINTAKEWVPNYEFIRNKYTEFDEAIFGKAMFEILVYGDMSKETKNELKSSIIHNFFADEEVFNNDPVASKRLDDLYDDAIEQFSIDAQYQTNKRYLRSIASKVNNILSSFTKLSNGQYERLYNDVEAVKEAENAIKLNKKLQELVNNDVITALINGGNDKNKNLSWKSPEMVFDIVSNKNLHLRQMLRDTLETERYDAQTRYVKLLNENNEVINKLVRMGITEGSKESKATQYILEGHKEDGSSYDRQVLKAEYDYKMKNGKKAYENIEEAADILRKAYDNLYNLTNETRKNIYGDVEIQNLIDTQKLLSDVEKQKGYVDNLKKEYTKNPSKELEAGIIEAQRKLERLINEANTKINKDAEKNSTRRQILPYRQNYAHHVQKKKGFLRSIKDAWNSERQVPTELSGVSDYSQPKTGFASFFKKQTTNANYVPDATRGFAEYMTDASIIIAYDPMIEYYRNFTSSLQREAKGNEMTSFVKWLNDYTNNLAGKTNEIDRGVNTLFKERTYNLVRVLNSRVKANSLLFNARTAITQFFNLPNALGVLVNNGGPTSSVDIAKGSVEFLSNMFNSNAVHNRSPFLTARYFDTNTGKKGLDVVKDKVADFMLSAGDEFATKLIWNSAYQQALRTHQDDPIMYADDLTRRSVAGRGFDEVPLALKSQFINLVMPFQVETNNAFQSIKGMLRNDNQNGMNSVSAVLSILLADWLMNNLSDWLFGDRILFDPIDVIMEGLEKELSPKDFVTRLGGEILTMTPAGQYIPSLLGLDESKKEEIFGESDPSRYGTGNVGLKPIGEIGVDVYKGNFLDALSTFMASYGMPSGGKQLQRTIEGAQTYGLLPQYQNDEWIQAPEYYTSSGKVGYVNDPSNLLDMAKVLVFGRWAGEQGRAYIDNGFKPLDGRKADLYENLKEESSATEANYDMNEIVEFKDSLEGKENAKLDFIDFIKEGDYTAKEKNEIYDEYYGESKLTTFLNDFSTKNKLSDEKRFEIKSIINITDSLRDENDKAIRNSKALSIRKQLTDLGVYDQYMSFIEENELELSYMGMNKTVANMSNDEFESEYNNLYSSNTNSYSRKSSAKSYKTSKTSKKSSNSSKKSSKTTVSEENEPIEVTIAKEKNKIDSIIANAYSNTKSAANTYDNINKIVKKSSKITSSNKENQKKFENLLKKYLEDHATDSFLFS